MIFLLYSRGTIFIIPVTFHTACILNYWWFNTDKMSMQCEYYFSLTFPCPTFLSEITNKINVGYGDWRVPDEEKEYSITFHFFSTTPLPPPPSRKNICFLLCASESRAKNHKIIEKYIIKGIKSHKLIRTTPS